MTKNSKMKILEKYKYQLIAFGLAFIPRLILGMMVIPVRVRSDEVATISSAALLAGKDWSEVVKHAGYYGFGFSAFFAPIFWLTDNPFVLYRCMIFGAILLQAGVALIAYYILKRHFKITDEKYLVLSSVTCSYMVVTRAMVVFNEHALIFSSWVIALCLLELVAAYKNKNSKAKLIYSTILMVVLIYTLTLHTRSITYWLVIGGVWILFLISERTDLVSWKVLLPVGLVGGTGSIFLIKLVQKVLWNTKEGEKLRNGKVALHLSTDFLSAENRGPWINILIGQVNTAGIVTAGLFFIALVLGIWYLVQYLRRLSNGQKQKVQLEWEYFILLLFFGTLILGTQIGMCFSWLKNMKEAMALGYDSWKYGMKATCYARYAGPFFGPVVMVVLAYVKQKKDAVIYPVWMGLVLTAGSLLVWMRRIYPYVRSNTYAVEIYLPFSFQDVRHLDMSKNVYLPMTIITFVVAAVFAYLILRNKSMMMVGLMALYLMYQYGYNAINNDLTDQKAYYKAVDQSYYWAKEHPNLMDTDTIYVIDNEKKSNHQTYYLYQFFFNDYRVILEYPENLEDIQVLFINDSDCLLEDLEDFQCIRLDDDEFVWVRCDNE